MKIKINLPHLIDTAKKLGRIKEDDLTKYWDIDWNSINKELPRIKNPGTDKNYDIDSYRTFLKNKFPEIENDENIQNAIMFLRSQDGALGGLSWLTADLFESIQNYETVNILYQIRCLQDKKNPNLDSDNASATDIDTQINALYEKLDDTNKDSEKKLSLRTKDSYDDSITSIEKKQENEYVVSFEIPIAFYNDQEGSKENTDKAKEALGSVFISVSIKKNPDNANSWQYNLTDLTLNLEITPKNTARMIAFYSKYHDIFAPFFTKEIENTPENEITAKEKEFFDWSKTISSNKRRALLLFSNEDNVIELANSLTESHCEKLLETNNKINQAIINFADSSLFSVDSSKDSDEQARQKNQRKKILSDTSTNFTNFTESLLRIVAKKLFLPEPVSEINKYNIQKEIDDLKNNFLQPLNLTDQEKNSTAYLEFNEKITKICFNTLIDKILLEIINTESDKINQEQATLYKEILMATTPPSKITLDHLLIKQQLTELAKLDKNINMTIANLKVSEAGKDDIEPLIVNHQKKYKHDLLTAAATALQPIDRGQEKERQQTLEKSVNQANSQFRENVFQDRNRTHKVLRYIYAACSVLSGLCVIGLPIIYYHKKTYGSVLLGKYTESARLFKTNEKIKELIKDIKDIQPTATPAA